MWQACLAPEHAPNVIASICAAAIGVFLIVRTLDQWQVQRARRRNQQHRPAASP